MSAIPRPVIIALLLAMASVAVVRNIVFFAGHGASGPVVGAGEPMEPPISAPIVAVGQPDAVIERRRSPTIPPEQKIAALRNAPVFSGDVIAVRDPFHLPPVTVSRPVLKDAASRSTPTAPEVRIVLISGQRQVAMVDSEIVAPGDVIAGRRVTQITADGLHLTGRDGEARIELSPLPTDLANDDLR